MKRLLVFFILFLPLMLSAERSGYSPPLLHVLEQLRQCKGHPMSLEDGTPPVSLPFIGGSDVGIGGAPGQFFLLIPYLRSWATDGDVALMMKDHSPVVRVMAAYLVLRGRRSYADLSLASLDDDHTLVEVAPGGCVHELLTVAETVKRMRHDADYFGERWFSQRWTEEIDGRQKR